MLRTVRRVAAVTAAVALTTAGLGVGIAAAQETPPPVAEIQNLTGRSTSVALDPGFVEALGSLQVEPSPVGDATVENGTAMFPITGGNVTVYEPGQVNPYVQGRIEHDGSGLALTAGETRVELTDFVIDPGDPAVLTGKVTANGEVAAESLPLFDLNGSTLEPITIDEQAGTATLTGTTVTLASDAATALNGTFGTDALAPGTVIGVATIVVNTASGDGQMPMPSGGVETGGGSTAGGGTDTALLAAGGVLVVGAAAAAGITRRRVTQS